MNSDQTLDSVGDQVFPAKVVRVIDETRVAINRGSAHGLSRGQRFLVFSISEDEIEDPDTGKSLGHLEIPKGPGTIVHVQRELSILEADSVTRSRKTIVRPYPQLAMFGDERETIESVKETRPFRDPEVGDLVKPI